MTNNHITVEEYNRFCHFLETKCGIVLGENKQYLVTSRLSSLQYQYGFTSLSALLLAVLSNQNRDLVIATIDAMTTNETFWFRDVYPFEQLANVILPTLAKTKKNLRIWSSASSSGQEPYSIAMVVQEVLSKNSSLFSSVNIVATDVSSSMLETCREGVYDSFALNRGLSPERKRLFFDSVDDSRMKVKDSLKRMITFKSQNLLSSYTNLGVFDVIFCRNVLFYFAAEMKVKILKQMANSLHPEGYLLLGASESLIGFNDEFETIFCNPGIIYKRK